VRIIGDKREGPVEPVHPITPKPEPASQRREAERREAERRECDGRQSRGSASQPEA
jgi:hypothetical protein